MLLLTLAAHPTKTNRRVEMNSMNMIFQFSSLLAANESLFASSAMALLVRSLLLLSKRLSDSPCMVACGEEGEPGWIPM